MLMFQAQAVELIEGLPSGWADEPHEKALWAVVTMLVGIVSLIIAYIRNQLRDRREYDKETQKAAKLLSSPHSGRTINGPTNSAMLLNYLIADVRVVKDRQDQVMEKLLRCEADIRELRRRTNKGGS